MDAKYLIFGATGSIGSNLADQLKKSGYENIHLVSRNVNELKNIYTPGILARAFNPQRKTIIQAILKNSNKVGKNIAKKIYNCIN